MQPIRQIAGAQYCRVHPAPFVRIEDDRDLAYNRIIHSQSDMFVHITAIPDPPPRVVHIPDHVRYHRIDRYGDTLRVNWPSPDKGMTMCYVYVHGRLRWVDVFDYAGENETNVLDFRPKFYQILDDGRDIVPADLRSM